MASNNKNLLKTLLTATAGCGCGSPKLSDVYEPKPKPKPKYSRTSNPKLCSSSSSSYYRNNGLSAVEETDDLTSTSFSFNNIIDTISSTTDLNSESEPEPDPDLPRRRPSKVLHNSPRPKFIDSSSITVVKDSNDPYQDFRDSMLQMVIEKEIYSNDDLQELLQCFLELNSPCHHDVIVKAFMEIWNQLISKEIVTVLQDQQHPCFVHGEKHGS